LTFGRKVISKVGNQLIRRMSGCALPADATTSFRVFEPELARLFLRHGLVAGCTGYSFFSLFVLFATITGPCREVPIDFRPRLVGSSNLTMSQCVQFARGLPDLRGRAAQWTRVAAAEPFGEASDVGCLQELAGMPNYARWIVEELAPWLHGSVLEVGAGIGTMTPHIAAADGVTAVHALEPDVGAHAALEVVCERLDNATATLGTLDQLAGQRFDTIVYINCLEHIRDEQAELRRARDHLAGADAHLVIFSPALEFLYGELDRVSGHWRRYSRSSLLAAISGAGYEVRKAKYVDLLSIAPYWLSSRALKRSSIGALSREVYDRYYVRAARTMHKAVSSPLGKSMLCVAVRSSP
jgi:2-polyprenyl-3-methyl-5-hydroxy-6-metoxy-1,4-benzoquinol methylase